MMVDLLHGLSNNTLTGICISSQLTVSFRLFANDMGMFIPAMEEAFYQAKAHLQDYELASGQLLNLTKSVVIPFGLPSLPPWLTEIGCTISQPGQVQRYLGAPWGIGLSEAQLHNFCLDRISERLKSWSARMLSFTGRVILVKHVLQAIPIYHMMFVKTPQQTAKKMERFFSSFLWGYNDEGGRKTALVSWNKLIRAKSEGGIGLKDLHKHSAALLSRWVTEALDNPDTDWAKMFTTNASLAKWAQSKQLQRAGYYIADLILFGKVAAFGKLTYTSGLWDAWISLRHHLVLTPHESKVPARWRTEDTLGSMPDFCNLPLSTHVTILSTLA
jgi:hypothetical protein